MVIDFWFDFASTYSYLSAMRIGDVAIEREIEVRWRPFLLGPIFKAQGWDTSPFNLYPAKGEYMWRDMERLCADAGLPFERPDPFPQNSLKAARLALSARDEPWFDELCRGLFRAQFGAGLAISDDTVLEAVLDDLGVDAAGWMSRITDPSIKDVLRSETEHAAGLGLFGAPTFVVGDELFWGNDRLDQAAQWAVLQKS